MRNSIRIRQATPAAARLTGLAGWSLIVVAVLHIVAFIPLAPWGEWIDGSLRSGDADPDSVAVFWALPGGIAIPAVLTGLLMIRFGRQGQRVPLAFGIALIAWVAVCVWLIGPSGFMAVLVTGGLLIAAASTDRRKGEVPVDTGTRGRVSGAA
ncbi:DUF6463 family protein [Glycomyces sp. TRM65418]|uniref:DUF6463 family protein n=1 Tax=Glycomyces sp. TRM65418 TaxID=2867006 RepID=UPI001CE5CA98|nr:DUF6463 family protein [Glycomyces sp. TRM65418]MCC3765142.1 DUF6463 family protein [Glycomyces sp. TRM65418]QZD54770.1 hypothetical protein K3N28_18855 [Glycomyces sp. TRM65418]